LLLRLLARRLPESECPPDDYNLVVFAFSSLTRTFNQAMTVHVRVV